MAANFMTTFSHGIRTALRRGVLLVVLLFAAHQTLLADEAAPDRDQRWQRIKALQQQLSGDAPKGANEIEFFAPAKAQLHREATEFAESAGNDPRRWEARLLKMKTDVFPVPAAERRTMFAQHEQIVADILNAADAPPEIKQNAERTILFQHLDHLDLVTTPQDAAVMEQRLVAYLHRYPNDSKAASMQVRRADLLAKSDPARVRPLLDELAASNNPKVAAAARGRLAQQVLAGAPLDWKFTAIDGREVDFSKLRGHVILIDYWASWCPDCLRALPSVQAAYRKYHDKGFDIVGISMDTDQDALLAFVKKHGMPWPQQCDGKKFDTALAREYGVGGIPEMWLVASDGKVAATGVQADDLDGQIFRLLVVPVTAAGGPAVNAASPESGNSALANRGQ